MGDCVKQDSENAYGLSEEHWSQLRIFAFGDRIKEDDTPWICFLLNIPLLPQIAV